MQVIEVNPQHCARWKYADRSSFEFGDIFALSQDIIKNGQIEPAILRKSPDKAGLFEVIAGSRRWKACLDAGIPLKGIVHDLSDEQAAVAQIKENQHVAICDYSKGIYYARLIKEKKMTVARLAESINCSKARLENFLAFDRTPPIIWDSVANLSKVSSRVAATIFALSKKGKEYVTALIELGEEIRKGIGSRTLERKVGEILKGVSPVIDFEDKITLPSGQIIARWTKRGLEFNKDIPLNQQKIASLLIGYYKNALKEYKSA